MAIMPETIAASRAAKRTLNVSILDRLILTPKLLRLKSRGT
jgi:hypothetical protein